MQEPQIPVLILEWLLGDSILTGIQLLRLKKMMSRMRQKCLQLWFVTIPFSSKLVIVSILKTPELTNGPAALFFTANSVTNTLRQDSLKMNAKTTLHNNNVQEDFV